MCQVFLLLTFAVLPVEKGQRHYLSIGLCVSLMLLEVSTVYEAWESDGSVLMGMLDLAEFRHPAWNETEAVL